MSIVELTPNTILTRVVRAAGSKKRKAILSPAATTVTLSGMYWDEGSRSEYMVVNLDTMAVARLPAVAPPQFGGPQVDHVYSLAVNQAVVIGGTFCGKPATPVVTFHPDYKM